MNPANPSLEQLFQNALDHDPDSRDAFLVRACAGDQALLTKVRRLLASDQEAEQAVFWSSSALEMEAIREAERPDERIGAVLGRYRIQNVISSGGMGTVYRAVRADSEYEQFAAIKIIKRGMDSDQVIRRFRTERQILAHLQHPNIARLLDGGTTPDGLPYLVMEYVEGLPIDTFADRHGLTSEQRLHLFRTVCAAVEYAHQNLVIHRDLKPGNILVSQSPGQPPTPKLLDFGIAKLLDVSAAPHVTMTLASFMTPEYASPEQVRGEPVTTVSDVYSLGVLLYKLLTGQSPYRNARTASHLASAICTAEPERPSSASRRDPAPAAGNRKRRHLRGDLDNIVLMALRKEPERRYASVGLFAEDIRRYLDGLPVMAHNDSLSYRARRFIRRNAIYVAAAALLFLTLTGGIVATAWQARVARTERTRAERRFQDVRKLATSLLFEIPDSIRDVPGTLAARQLIVQRGLEYLDSLAPEAGDDRALRSELAIAYNRVGTLTFHVETSLAAHRKALAINQSLVREEPHNPVYAGHLADSYELMAAILRDLGDSAGALENSRHAVEVIEGLAASEPARPEWRAELLAMYQSLGVNLSRLGRYAEELTACRKALKISQALVSAAPDNNEYRLTLVQSYIYLGRAQVDVADYSGALETGRRALELGQALHSTDPDEPTYRRELWLAHVRMAQALENLGRAPESLAEYTDGLEIIRGVLAADPGDRGNARGVAWTLMSLGRLLERTHRLNEAVQHDQEAIAISRRLLAEDPNKLETTIDLGDMYTRLASAQIALRAGAPAAASIREARYYYQTAASRDPQNALIRRGRAELDRLSR